MLNQEDYLLTCLAEECSEIAEQCARIAIRAAKTLRFGTNEVQPGQDRDNIQRLVAEFTDLLAVIEEMESCGLIRRDRVQAKRLKLETFMAYAREIGSLEP